MASEVSEDPKLALEVVRLLLQAVWADGEVQDEEASALHDYAVRAGVPNDELETLDACLAGTQPLVPPNLGLLKGHRTLVLREVRKLVTSDQRIHEDEEELIADVAALLA